MGAPLQGAGGVVDGKRFTVYYGLVFSIINTRGLVWICILSSKAVNFHCAVGLI